MEYRNLGSAGVKISPVCLGTMMFGSWGNPDRDDCARIIHRAMERGINFPLELEITDEDRRRIDAVVPPGRSVL